MHRTLGFLVTFIMVASVLVPTTGADHVAFVSHEQLDNAGVEDPTTGHLPGRPARLVEDMYFYLRSEEQVVNMQNFGLVDVMDPGTPGGDPEAARDEIADSASSDYFRDPATQEWFGRLDADYPVASLAERTDNEAQTDRDQTTVSPTDPNDKAVRIGAIGTDNPDEISEHCDDPPTPDPNDPDPTINYYLGCAGDTASDEDQFQSVSFVTTPAMAAQDLINIYEIEVELNVRCRSGGTASSGSTSVGANPVVVQVYRNALGEDGTWQRVDNNPLTEAMDTLTPSISLSHPVGQQASTGTIAGDDARLTSAQGMFEISGEIQHIRSPVDVNPAGWQLEKGERLELHFNVGSSDGCYIHYDTTNHDSWVRIQADSLRPTVWIEKDGKPTTGVARPDAAAKDRVFTIKEIYADAWGDVVHATRATEPPTSVTRIPDNPVGQPGTERLLLPVPGIVKFRHLDTLSHVDNFASGTLDRENLADTEYPILGAGDDPAAVRQLTRQVSFNTGTAIAEYRVEVWQNFWPDPFALTAISPTFAVGKTGMEFGLAAGQDANRLVNPEETTIFTYRVANKGSSLDRITVNVNNPGSGWTAKVLNPIQDVPGDGAALVNIEVTAPASATVGDTSPPIVAKAISTFTNVVPPINADPVTVSITGDTLRQLSLEPASPQLIMGPGQTRNVALTVSNEGYGTDQMLVTAAVPSNVAGWTATVSPVAKQVFPGSNAEYELTLKAPTTAPGGLGFPVTVSAQVVGDSATLKTRVIDVDVVVTHSFEAETTPQVLQLKPIAPADENTGDCNAVGTQCRFIPPSDPGSPNARFPESAVYVVAVENTGDSEDTYTLKARWDTTDSSCINGNHPAGWRLSVDPFGQGGLDRSAAREVSDTITVPAGATGHGVVEFHNPFGTCTSASAVANEEDDSHPNPKATLTVSSGNNPALTESFSLEAQRSGGITHSVRAQIDPSTPAKANVVRGATSADPTYLVHASQTGTEEDDLIFRVPAPPIGWGVEASVHSFSMANGKSHVGEATDCSVSSNDRQVRCGPLQPGEEVVFGVKYEATNALRVGMLLPATFTVQSGRDATNFATIDVLSRVGGEFAFELTSLAPITQTVAGEAAYLPFQIENIGTSQDKYDISVIVSQPDWKPRLGSGDTLTVPAGHVHNDFLVVEVPDGTATGSEEFRIEVRSRDDRAVVPVQTAAFAVEVIAGAGLRAQPAGDREVLVADRGAGEEFTIAVIDESSASIEVNVTPELSGLPAGWTVEATSDSDPDDDENHTVGRHVNLTTDGSVQTGTVTFRVTPAKDALGTSQVPIRLRVDEVNGTRMAFTDVVVRLQSEDRIKIGTPFGASRVIAPGHEAVFTINVTNQGLDAQQIKMDPGAFNEDKWNVTFTPPLFTLAPLEEQLVDVRVLAKDGAGGAQQRDVLELVVFASGGTATALTTLQTTVGFFDLGLEGGGEVPRIGPQDVASHTLTLRNNGTAGGTVRVEAVVEQEDLRSSVALSVSEQEVPDLLANQSRSFSVQWTLSSDIPSDTELTARVTASFEGNATGNTTASQQIRLLTHRYVAFDADLDGIREYALDIDRDRSNGFEVYRESKTPGGRVSTALDMSALLSDAARAAFSEEVETADGNTTSVLRFMIDGDGDGRVDHFLDTTGNGLPDFYYDPDSRFAHEIGIFRDVDADNVPEYFVDVDDSGVVDHAYNVRTGQWIPILILDVTGDGKLDFGIDANGDGIIGEDETVLYTKDGILIKVMKVDVDGDGRLDSVFDVDGDDIPDHFIRAGETKGRPLTLRDVNGDGVLDWLYDADLDGREDHYYNPATQSGGHPLDARTDFMENVREYWFIPALFALVLVLFVALLAVTRR